MMNLTPLTAISPIDGRYLNQLHQLQSLFSEKGLMHHRIIIEIRWFETLANYKDIKALPPLSITSKRFLQSIIDNFSDADANRIKELEKKTNHDVKAVEYFLKEKFSENPALKPYSEFLHFACTSDDINNLAYGLMIREAKQHALLSLHNKLISILRNLAHQYSSIPMLAQTHGQAATPTTLGKELANFVARLKRQKKQIGEIDIMGKMNGAVGNFNAHCVAYPNIDWPKLCNQFVTKLGLAFNDHTTQIEPHDYIAEFSHTMIRFNTILIGLSRDIWLYISKHYFSLKKQAGEVGSSTMPHKVNPIDFENAEGNLGIANSLFGFFANELPTSRLQRDLTDSTIMRNIGVAFAHSILAYHSLLKGLNKVEANKTAILKELNNHWEILAEAAQTIMRKHGVKAPYETLKKLTRGKSFNKKTWLVLVNKLDLPKREKEKLKKLTPEKYIGEAAKLANKI